MARTRDDTRRLRTLAILTGTVVLGVATSAVIGQHQTASGDKDDRNNNSYRIVGDGTLPTTRPALRAPGDSLSAAEVGYAIHLATTDASIPADATGVLRVAGPEVLLTELPAQLTSGHRLAVVHLYDYTDNVGYQQRVDLTSRDVNSQPHKRLQPPISPTEATEATRIAIAQRPRLAFVEEFETSQGMPLLSPDQVTPVAGTFVHDGSTRAGQECGLDRCAQLMIRVPSGAYLSTWDFVVDLSAKTVIRIR